MYRFADIELTICLILLYGTPVWIIYLKYTQKHPFPRLNINLSPNFKTFRSPRIDSKDQFRQPM
jgi:hypothetical protein